MVLSEEQKKIVQATEPQIAVVGPPGTGKTRVLTERILYLINQGIDPKDIVAITFTNFAANEMKSRLPNCDIFIGTMHSYAIQILRKNNITIDINKIVQDGDFAELINKVIESDLQLDKIKYLFVDEVQDLCQHEFDFIKKLNYENIFLGGDADQCIYQFKGAKPKLFLNYCKKANTKTYILTHNYRSGQNIIDWAEYFVKKIPDRLDVHVTGNLQARGWVHKENFYDTLSNLYGLKNYSNWFILARTNAELTNVAKILEENSIPYLSFKQGDFSNEEIKSFLNDNAVKLLTIHSSKGLETDNVIVIGARGWSIEECCIEYVAATRARNNLYWCPSLSSPKRVMHKKKVINNLVWD